MEVGGSSTLSRYSLRTHVSHRMEESVAASPEGQFDLSRALESAKEAADAPSRSLGKLCDLAQAVEGAIADTGHLLSGLAAGPGALSSVDGQLSSLFAISSSLRERVTNDSALMVAVLAVAKSGEPHPARPPAHRRQRSVSTLSHHLLLPKTGVQARVRSSPR